MFYSVTFAPAFERENAGTKMMKKLLEKKFRDNLEI